MKKVLFTMILMMTAGFIFGQTTYYWVGGTAATTGINTGANWNTDINGAGSSRPSSTGASDILVFDGTNLGGTTPATGPAAILASSGITCAQVRFVNNVNVTMSRPTSGTSQLNFDGELGDDFFVAAGSTLIVNSPLGSVRFTFRAGADMARIDGTVSFITSQQMRFENILAPAAKLVFTNGSSFSTNISATSAAYAFGNSSQATEQWVTFEDGAHLYYLGGSSPFGSNSTFSPLNLKPGSIWHQRTAFAATGSYTNKKSFGNVIVENNSTFITDGPIYRINNLTVNTGCTFTAYSSGQTAIMGDLTVNGIMDTDPASTNEVIMAGNGAQIISGTGTIAVAGLTIGNNSSTTINKNIALITNAKAFGKINFTNRQLTGVVNFDAKGITAPVIGAGTTAANSYVITAHSGIGTDAEGQLITGPGIPANTTVVRVSVTDDQIVISNPATASGAAVALTVSSNGATLQSASTNGYNPATGSVLASGNMNFQSDLNYIVDAATTWPFGVTTGSTDNMIFARSVDVNANITVNKGVTIKNNLFINAKMTLRPADTVHILTGAGITGTFGATKYIATDYVTGTGVQSIVRYDGISSAKTIPLGTVNYYLPVTITPVSVSSFSTAVFQGITTNGLLNGTAFTATQRLRVVNAVWNINRLSGTGSADLQLSWNNALEGTTFNTLPDDDIGLIRNIGSGPTGWAPPVGTGNNTTNIVMGSVTTFGSFGAGAIPQVNAFIYNDLPIKTYGNPDFNGGATSLNTTNPIIYTSSNPAVATIVSGNIHIVSAGVSNITASQMGDGVFPDTMATKILTVNKAALTIKADDKSKFELVANPPLTITYTGFVLGETNAVFLTQPSISTTAVLASLPGTYPITVTGVTAANYAITHTNGTLTVIAKTAQTITFNQPVTKTYGNAAFATGATSTNSTTPITYTSSNTGVATVTGNTITITGAGTTVITAMQAGSDGFFPAPNIARTLTVNKVNLTIRATDTTKITGVVNPVFRLVYTGFVLGETAANLTTQPVVSTTATTISSPGYYSLIPTGAVSQNYNIIITNGRLTVLPTTGTTEQYLIAYRNANGNIAVRVYSPAPYLGDIYVFNTNGSLVAKKNIFMPVGFAYVEIPAQSLTSGIYVIAVRGEGVKLEKMIHFIK